MRSTCSITVPIWTRRHLIAGARSELERVSRIVRQSLSYYRTGTAPQKVDLAAMVEESLLVFSGRLQGEGVRLSKKLTRDSAIIGFADELRQAIDNLLLNAIEAMPQGGRLAVSVRPSGNWKEQEEQGVRLTVADS